jgi:chaperonin GroES
MKLVPNADWCVVREEEDTVTKGGIFLAPSNKLTNRGTVLAVGPGRYSERGHGELIPMRTKVGDKVVFSKHGCHEDSINGEKFFMVCEREILATIKDGEYE